jgi:hypothetical protein
VKLNNTGGGALAVSSIKITGANATSFVTSNTCGTSLASGTTCNIGVRFVPATTGPLAAAITLTDNAAGSPQVIELSGTGVAVPESSLSLSSASLAFGNEATGDSTGAQSVRVTNTSGVTLYFEGIALSGANATSFVTSNTCGTSLASGATCNIGVRLAPTTTGPLAAAITLTDNAAGSPQVIELSGAGVAVPESSLSLSSASVAFGNEATGDSTGAQSVKVTNTSGVTLYFKSIALSGANATSFVTSNTCGTSLASGATCNIGVRFVPTTTGTLAAAITLIDNAAGGMQSIALTGTGYLEEDVLVYKADPSGIAAAIEAAHLGKRVVLLEPTQHVGGMMSSGLGTSDVYGTNVIGGLAATFFQTVATNYGPANATLDFSGTHFEPHIAEQAFNQMLAQQANITVVLGVSLSAISMNGTRIATFTASNGITYGAKEFIDASYEGDLMAAAHVSYATGREATSQYGEPLAGVQIPTPLDGLTVDPYVVAGDPASGLLQHVQAITLGAPGSADNGVMAYNYRLCVSQNAANQIPFPVPPNYNPEEFEVLGRFAAAVTASKTAPAETLFLGPGQLPNQKLDVNNGEPFSTDETGESVDYANADPATRAQIAAEVTRYMQSLLHFLATDPRIPPHVQAHFSGWGLCKDEFTDNGGWPWQLYVREARRMIGAYVMTQSDIEGNTTIADPIGLGGYAFDSHDVHRVAVNGMAENEGLFSIANQAYPIPYRALTPMPSQVTNLLVSVEVSASRVANTSLRLEPTYMIMGQAAGAAASEAIDEGASVQSIDYATLANQLTSDGQVLAKP